MMPPAEDNIVFAQFKPLNAAEDPRTPDNPYKYVSGSKKLRSCAADSAFLTNSSETG
jgi:hypothetical protein